MVLSMLQAQLFTSSPFSTGYSLTTVALLSVGIFFARLIAIFVRPKSGPRTLPGVFVAGLDDGKRTMEQAEQYFITNCADMMLEGYRKTQGDFFYVPSPGRKRLMIPTRYIEELKNAPNEQVDFTASFSEMFEGGYTTIGQKWHLHPGVVKKSLNVNLAAIMPAVEDEIVNAYETLLPPSDDWMPVKMAGVFTQIISRASNRMLGGKALSRNSEWTTTSINFTTDTWMAAQRLKKFSPFLRPVVQFLIPEMKKVRSHGVIARRVVCPIVESRRHDCESKELDLLQMLWEGAEGNDKTPQFMAYTALAISFAAIRTSSSIPTHLLYDLCANPRYISPLRKEIEDMLAEQGSFTKAGLNKLVKLDSFMKESQRFNPLSLLTFGRVIHRDYVLHDGITIPGGTFIGIASHAITHDAEFYHFPSTFQPFRFVPSSSDKTTPSFVTTNASNLSWGYGKHACSGRFFAANEIKIIFSHFLLNYDFKFERAGRERPPNYAFELQNMADEDVVILVRKRKF